MKLYAKVKASFLKRREQKDSEHIFRNEKGAIDLSSIMVGVIVIGLIGGVIAATVFAIIPWTQDNAAKQQLDSIQSAQAAYFGLSSAVPSPLPAGSKTNSYADSELLEKAGLMTSGNTYCAASIFGGEGYKAFAKSATGKVWYVTDKSAEPKEYMGSLPANCKYVNPYMDSKPTSTILTYMCDVTTTGALPLKDGLTGTLKWNDSPAKTYSNAAQSDNKTLTAGTEYTVVFEGTYKMFGNSTSGLAKCLRSLDHIGTDTQVTSFSGAFYGATNLTFVPEHIPTTVTTLEGAFVNASKFNHPNVSKWDVSNVTSLYQTFSGATVFNQPLNDWDVSKARSMYRTFHLAKNFDQSLDSWDTSNVTTMREMFDDATAFNQPLNTWNTAKVENMSEMFYKAANFNQDLNEWDTGKVKYMNYMFFGATKFNGDITDWNTVSVLEFPSMLRQAPVFNHDLSGWDTSSLTSGNHFADNTFNSAYLPPKATLAP